MSSCKLDFSSCAIRDGSCKFSHTHACMHTHTHTHTYTHTAVVFTHMATHMHTSMHMPHTHTCMVDIKFMYIIMVTTSLDV